MLKKYIRKFIQIHIVFGLILHSNFVLCQDDEKYYFNLPAMDAAAALDKIADTSGYSLIYPFDHSTVVITNALLGRYSLAQALEKLLLNTPLSAVATDKRVIAVSSLLNDDNAEHFARNMLIKDQLKQQLNSLVNNDKSFAASLPAINLSYRSENEQESLNKETEAERIQIIGSRRINRSPSDALAPLDIINKQDLMARGNSDIIATLSSVIPSYNSNQEAISDAGTVVRPANLRGLPTDSMLILVNGKRRHRSGVIYEYISGLNVGAHGVDLEPIPSIALKSVEVLRDGAAAQYGSDAIAGVINFRLENDGDINRIELRTGQYYQGDGTKLELSGIFGTKLGGKGTANFSFDVSQSDATSRGIQDPAVQTLIASGISQDDIQDPVVIWGAPEISNNIKTFANIEIDLGTSNHYQQLYLFSNWAVRDLQSSFFYRHPNTRAGVFTNPFDGTRLFFDMTADQSGNCPLPTLPSGDGDAQALAAVFANPDCFSFNERFPGGFTPRFAGSVTDTSIASGLRGAFDFANADLSYDLSMVLGRSDVEYQLHNTANVSLGAYSPTDFQLGAQIQTERVFNADFTLPIDLGFESELNIAFGYQNHFEQYEIVVGDKTSYQTGPFTSNGEAIGANGFPGFSPDTADINSRISNAVYLDMEGDITEYLAMSLAIRYENIEKIGETFDGKLSARLQLSDEIALRSTISSGFRAPTVGQSTLQRVSTSNLIVDDIVVQQSSQLVSALSPIATARSGGGLKPESATSFSVGVLSEFGVANVTLDYFYIDVYDRLSLFTSEITASDAPFLTTSEIKANVTNIQYYANDFNSTTQGVDLVASVPFEFFGGNNLLSLAFNYTDTQLEVTNSNSPIANINVRKEREDGVPKTRSVLTFTHWQGDFNAMARLNYYGSFYNAQFNDVSLIEKVPAWLITDVELSYNLSQNLVVALGAKNIFDVYPDEFSEGRTPGFLGAIYPLNSPSGFNGGYYYLRLLWDF